MIDDEMKPEEVQEPEAPEATTVEAAPEPPAEEPPNEAQPEVAPPVEVAPEAPQECVAVAVGQSCPKCGYNRSDPKRKADVHPVVV